MAIVRHALVAFVAFSAAFASLLPIGLAASAATAPAETVKASAATVPPLVHNRETWSALEKEAALNRDDPAYLAVLRGLEWCVTFCDNDDNFDFTFTNYLTMLDELSCNRAHPGLVPIVHRLIVREIARAAARLEEIFSNDLEGYEDLISILPIAYHHGVDITPLKEFAAAHLKGITPPDRLAEFRKVAKELDYDRLTDMVIGAAFIDMAYRWGIDRHFRLPPNHFATIMKECSSIPFLRKYKEAGYHDQNYYATHVLLALNHYGQKGVIPSETADQVFFYLVNQYKTVRESVGDLDLLCEYLYCFRQLLPPETAFIREGEDYILSQQRGDGSWGTADDFKGDPYDQLHPTWTAITLLVHRDGRGKKAGAFAAVPY